MIKFKILRTKKSYDFKADPNKPDSFENNWKNNSLDWLSLTDGNNELFRCRCQTVANYCFGAMSPGDTVSYGDTVAPGTFTVKCFVEPRLFHGEIHAITSTTDIDGQKIDRNAMQVSAQGFQNGRWLIHDRWSKKYGRDTNCAWSAGCFILSSGNLEALNTVLHSLKIQPGETLPGELIEIE